MNHTVLACQAREFVRQRIWSRVVSGVMDRAWSQVDREARGYIQDQVQRRVYQRTRDQVENHTWNQASIEASRRMLLDRYPSL